MPGLSLVVTTQRLPGSARSAWTHSQLLRLPGRAGECGRCATPDCENHQRRVPEELLTQELPPGSTQC